MGGEVLELLNDRAKRLEREAQERGLELGLEQGLELGLEQGLDELTEKLKSLGMDEAIIQTAVDEVRRERAASRQA